VVVDCQENRSFDHYYGYAPFAGSFGVPPGYAQPDGHSGFVSPCHFASFSTPDIGHSWSAMHAGYDGGAMDGCLTTDGLSCMGYYTQQDLPFYYSLLGDFTLRANYFSPVTGPTSPDRFYLVAGTSGGITTNGIWGYGVFDYPIILDLLEAAGITWKVYNTAWDPVPHGDSDNAFVFWERWANDVRTRATKADYLADLSTARCRRFRSSSPVSCAARTSTHRPTSAWAWESSKNWSLRCRIHRPGTARCTSSPTTSPGVLRPCPAAPTRRLRAGLPGPDVGDLPVRQEGPPGADRV